jgi:uracil-DNA glycosylase family 4
MESETKRTAGRRASSKSPQSPSTEPTEPVSISTTTHTSETASEKRKEPEETTEIKKETILTQKDADDKEEKERKAAQLEKIKQEIINDVDLPLSSPHLVFGRGDPNSDIVFIGEAPGKEEEKQGQPFVGPAGRRLNQLLQSMGLSTDNVYICNVLKYRPPENRDPSVREVELHTPYLLSQLHIIKPKLIVPLGNWATKYVLSGFDPKKMNKVEGMMKMHGKKTTVVSHEGDSFAVIPAFHPAAVLHNTKWEPHLQEDFEKIREYKQSEEFKKPKPARKVNAGAGSAKKKQKTLETFFGGKTTK